MEFNATFIIAGISFIIFTLLMNKILYQPLSEIVLKRKNYISANLDAAKQNSDKAKSIQDGISDKINAFKAESRQEVNAEVDNLKQLRSQKLTEKKSEVSENTEIEKSKLAQEKLKVSKQLLSDADELSDELLSKFFGGRN